MIEVIFRKKASAAIFEYRLHWILNVFYFVFFVI